MKLKRPITLSGRPVIVRGSLFYPRPFCEAGEISRPSTVTAAAETTTVVLCIPIYLSAYIYRERGGVSECSECLYLWLEVAVVRS